MTELELWKRIASNAHKVEGLREWSIHEWIYPNGNDGYEVGCDTCLCNRYSHPHDHRAAALLVVDAIEKAGLAGFKRNGMKYAGQWSVIDARSDEKRTDTRQEHLSLLECIAYVLEGLE